jgi:hypothetical protein
LFSDEFDKPEYENERAFIDVLCVPQNDLPDVFETTNETYSHCWMVIFVDGGYLSRAWCCLEIAFATMTGSKLTVIGQCNMVEGRNFFESMQATMKTDIPRIKDAIKKLFKSDTKFELNETQTAQRFNDIVAHAMEVLFVQAHKDSVCNLFTDARAKRGDWGERIKFSSPPNLPRDREKDWGILTGQAREVEEAQSRTVRLFLLSTLMDTVLEWGYFLQDCASYLMACARERGLDLILSDMRHGSREEEALPVDMLSAELKCCKDTSADLCCLAIVCSKYGFRPAPARIPKAEFEELVKLMSDENAVLCKEAYELDCNKLPAPEYVMRDAGHSKLTTALRGAAKLLWPEAVELRDPTRSVPLHNLYFSFFSVTEDTWQFPPHPGLLRVGPRAAHVHQHPGRRTGPRVSAGLSQR